MLHSPQLNQNWMPSVKNVQQDLPNVSRPEMLENYEIFGKSQNCMGTQSSIKFSIQK